MLHHFPGEDGLPLSGWLFRPALRACVGAVPTLIWLHGGPEAQERPIFQPLFQALLAEGVAVFAPNVRGSGGYGRTFSRPTTWSGGSSRSRTCAPRSASLVEHGLADPTRIGVSGRSYGGYLTLVALAWFPELFRVGVDVCGISDFATFYARDRAVDRRRGGHQVRRPAGRRRAAASSCRRSTASTGSPRRCWWCTAPHDTNVPIVEAEQIVEALRDRGASPGFLLFDDEGHEVHATANRVLFVREVVRWVTGHLLDVGEQTA